MVVGEEGREQPLKEAGWLTKPDWIPCQIQVPKCKSKQREIRTQAAYRTVVGPGSMAGLGTRRPIKQKTNPSYSKMQSFSGSGRGGSREEQGSEQAYIIIQGISGSLS